MAQTPTGTATPYCTAVRLFDFHDSQQVADLLREGDNPRPTRLRMLDDTTAEGAKLLRVLLAASGELESACLVGNRYAPADLAALVAADKSGAGRLRKVVADLAFWALSQNRQPNASDPKTVPGALQAVEELDRLRSGERIFGMQEAGDAGLPGTSTPDPAKLLGGTGVVQQAGRLFGDRGHTRRRC